MSELTELISNSRPISIHKLCKFLFDQYTIQKLNNSDSPSFLTDILTIISNPYPQNDEKEREQINLILLIFLIAYKPSSKKIKFDFPFNTQNGYIFASSLVVYSMFTNEKNYIHFFHELISKDLSIFFNNPNSKKQQYENFFTISPCYYYQIIPTFFGENILDQQYSQSLSSVLLQVCNLKQEDLNLSIITFISEIYKSIKNNIMLKMNSKLPLPNNFLDSIINIVELTQKYPTICLSVFFHTWFFLVRQCINSHQTQPLLHLIPTITKCFEKVSSCKYHELHRSFPWYLCYWFYDFVKKEEHTQKVQVLSLICNGIRTEPRMNIIHRQTTEESVQMFAMSIVSQSFDNQPYYLYYVLTSLISSSEVLIYKMKKIHAYGQIINQSDFAETEQENGNETENSIENENKEFNLLTGEKLVKRQISFFEQSNFSSDAPIYDHYLYSYTYEKYYQSEIECIEDFEQMGRICENIHKYVQSIEILFESIFLNIKKILTQELENNPNYSNSVPFYYMHNIFKTMINFMINATHKQMLIKSYFIKEAFDNTKVTSQYINNLSNPRKFLDFTNIYQLYFKLFDGFPLIFVQSLANVIVDEILMNLKKGTITLLLVETLSIINKDKMNDPNSIIYITLNRLIESASVRINLLMEKDVADVNSFYLLIFFTIRLATFNGRNPWFGITLKLYQKLFFSSVMANTKFIFHQTIAMRLISHYLIAVNENDAFSYDKTGKKFKMPENIKLVRYKPANSEEFELNAQLNAINAVLDISLEEPDYMPIMMLIPILDMAFCSNESFLIEKASRICLRVFKNENPENYSDNQETVRRLFKHFFDSSKTITDLELSAEILSLLPKYAHMYLHNPPLMGNEQKVRFPMKNVNIDLLEVLKAISLHMNYSDEEIKHIFALVSVGFEIILDSIIVDESTIAQTLLQLINMLKYCFGFQCLSKLLGNLTSYITKSFGDLFLRGDSDLYIICVFDAMGMNRLDSTLTIMKLAVSFFEYCKGKPVNPHFVSKTLENLFFFFPLSTRLFSILCGFSLGIRYYPEFITLSQVRSFLIQTTETNPVDDGFNKMLNSFLKEFLIKNDHQTKKDFVALVYENICPLSISVRRILEKRVSKLKIPIHINSLDEILTSTRDYILLFQKLTLAFLCDIEGDIMASLNSDWAQKVFEFINPLNLNGIHRFDKYARILSLIKSILFSEKIFRFFVSINKDFVQQIVKLLCQALISHFQPIQHGVKKCFSILINRYPDEMSSITQISEFWKNYTKYFWNSSLNRIVFCTQLSKIFPEKASEDIVPFLMNEISVYLEKSDSEKMNLVPTFVRILEQLAVKKFINQENIRSIILAVNEEGFSYIEFYINSIMILFRNPAVPFRGLFIKPVSKFLSMFPSQTTNYLINITNENSLCNFNFLQYLIIYDKKDIFFRSFLEVFKSEHDFTSLSPAAYRIFQKLTSVNRFINDKELLAILKHEFTLVIRSINDPSKVYENEYELLSVLTNSILNIYQENLELTRAISLAAIFQYSFFSHSNLYKKYISIVFHPSRIENIQYIFQQILLQYHKINPLNLSILLPHCLKALPSIKEEEVDKLFGFEMLKSDDPIYVTIGLRCARILISKMNIKENHIKLITKDLKKCFNSSDVETIVYSLKLSVKLLEKNYLPEKLFEAIVKQIFSFMKFFEAPYSVYSFALLKTRPDFIENLSSSTIDTISFFFYDKFTSFREMQKSMIIILSLSKIFKHLPFSLFTSISSLLDEKVSNITNTIPPEVTEVIFFSVRLYMSWEPNEAEKEYFFKVGFKFIQILLDQPKITDLNRFSEFIGHFFTFLTEFKSYDPRSFPIDFLEKIEEVNNDLYFDIVCSASRFIPDILYDKYSNLVENSLVYLTKVKTEKDNEEMFVKIPLLNDLLNFIFSEKEKYDRFSFLIFSSIDNLLQNYSASKNKCLYSIIHSVIFHHFDSAYMNILPKLFILQNQLFQKQNKSLFILFFQMILKLLEIMPIDNQMSYFMTIFEEVQWNSLSKSIFTKNVHCLIKCPYILIKVKKEIIDTFPTLLFGTTNELEKIVDSIIQFGKNNRIEVINYIIYVKIIIASISNPSQRLICFDQIESLLNFNFKNRLKFFIHELPLVLWSDEYFIFIVALLTEKVKIWQPIFAFSPKLKNVSDLLAISAFKRLLDEEISFELQQFLKRLLKQQKEIRNNYTKAISSIVQTFFRSDFLLPFCLAYKASCVSGDFEFDHHFFRQNDICQKRFVMPECRNHFYFGLYLPQLTMKQACTAALTLLYQYNIAERFYQEDEPSDPNSYYGQIRSVNQHLIEPQQLTFSEIIRPLIKINRKTDSVVILLEKAVDAYFQKQIPTVIQLVKDIKQIALEDFRSHLFSSIYQNERIIVIEILSDNILKLIETNDVGDEADIMKKYSCLNPSFLDLINDFTSFLKQEETLPNDVIIDSNEEKPCIIISPINIFFNIKKVTGITSHGLYALSPHQINEAFETMSNKIEQKTMQLNDYIAYAPFCFNIFTIVQTFDFFSTAYHAYYNIFTFKENTKKTLFIKEASARIVTMIRIAEKNESKNFQKPILDTSSIFMKSYAEIWRFWLQQLVELARKKWFRDIAMDLFCEMHYRSTLYAKKSLNKEIQDNLRHEIASRNNLIQNSMMEKIEVIVNRMYTINTEEFEHQKSIINFIEESIKLSDEELDKIELIEERKKGNIITPFDDALLHLMKEDIEKIGDLKTWISKLREMDNEELGLFVKTFTNSTETFSSQRKSIDEAIDNFNDQLPFIFPIHLDYAPQLSVFRFNKDISYLLPELIVCRATTSVSSRNTFLIQKSINENGLHSSVITLATCFSLFRIILQNSYASRMRAINLAVSFCFEIGERTLLMQLMSYPISLKDLFEKEMMIRQKEWVKKYTNPENGTITEEGLENVKTFTTDSLAKYHAKTMPEKTFIALRRGLAESYAAAVIIRYMLSAPYQDMGRIIACTQAADIPVLLTDFDNGESFLNESINSTFRLSPTMQVALGPQIIGELFLSMASVAHAFTTHLESIRSYIELIVGDEMSTQVDGEIVYDDVDDPDIANEIIRRRTIIENRFISLSPPKPKIENINTECMNWYDNLMKIIEKSRNPFVQPVYTVPWF